ncbi:MAG: sel1 repeat family protein [Alphaproteobacteria bacterium]|nr:sel1 repeat family protein [Alphaproteobacteria bacterium]
MPDDIAITLSASRAQPPVGGRPIRMRQPPAREVLDLPHRPGFESDVLPLLHLMAAAEAGDPGAMYFVGLRFLEGRGVAKDVWHGARFIETAANAGVIGASFTLGILRFAGLGVARDLAAAYRWLTDAARVGYPGAEENLQMVARWLDQDERAAALGKKTA